MNSNLEKKTFEKKIWKTKTSNIQPSIKQLNLYLYLETQNWFFLFAKKALVRLGISIKIFLNHLNLKK